MSNYNKLSLLGFNKSSDSVDAWSYNWGSLGWLIRFSRRSVLSTPLKTSILLLLGLWSVLVHQTEKLGSCWKIDYNIRTVNAPYKKKYTSPPPPPPFCQKKKRQANSNLFKCRCLVHFQQKKKKSIVLMLIFIQQCVYNYKNEISNQDKVATWSATRTRLECIKHSMFMS